MFIDQLTIATTNVHSHESTLFVKTLRLLPVYATRHFAGGQVTFFHTCAFDNLYFNLDQHLMTFSLSIICLITLEQRTGLKHLSKGQNNRDAVKVFSKKYYHSCASLGTSL